MLSKCTGEARRPPLNSCCDDRLMYLSLVQDGVASDDGAGGGQLFVACFERPGGAERIGGNLSRLAEDF